MRLFVVFSILIGINVYVFLLSPGSLKAVSKAAQAASMRGERPLPIPAAPVVPVRKREGALRAREGLGAALRREGVAADDVDEALRALRPLLDFKHDLRAGQRYTVRCARAGRLVDLELRARGVAYVVSRAPDGRLLGAKGQVQRHRRTRSRQ